MYKTTIKLCSIKNAIGFSNDIRNIAADVDLGSGRYIIDAKSVMGLFSLDLSKEVELRAYTEDKVEIDKVIAIVKKYNEA